MNQGSFDPSLEFTFVNQRGMQNGEKELFFAGTDYNANKNDYRARSIAASGAHRFTFYIPSDFSSLVELVLVGIANATIAGVDIDLQSDYALAGEDSQTNSESDVTSTYSFTNNFITEIDISAVFSNLAAGHYCGLFVDHNGIGTTVNYLGVRMRYRST
jgi:hypothetical protein